MHRYDPSLRGQSGVDCLLSPEIAWIFESGDQFKAAPVVAGEYIVAGNTAGTVFCLDMYGKLLWKDSTDNSIEAPVLILDNTVYVGNLSGNLYALDLFTGKRKWVYQADNQIMGAPNWYRAEGQTCLLAGSYDYYLHCVDAATGSSIWKYELDNYLNGTVAVSGQRAVFGGCDGFMHVVDLITGKALQRFDVATYIAGSPVIFDHFACTGDYDGGMTCADLNKNIISWTYRDDKNTQAFVASPATNGALIFNGSRDKHAYCFDCKSGEVIWKVNTGMKIDASPVIANNGVVFINTRGELYLLNENNGAVMMQYDLGVPVFSSPAVVNNALVISAADGNIYFLTQ